MIEEMGQAIVVVEEDMQRKRLLMQYSKFRSMASNLHAMSSHLARGSLDAAQKVLQPMTRELQNVQLWERKLKAIENALSTDQSNYILLVEEQQRLAAQAEAAIQQQKADLIQARKVQQWNQECEKLRQDVMAFPTKNGIESDCQQLEQYFLKLRTDDSMLDASLNMQRKQHALLLHCLEGISIEPAT